MTRWRLILTAVVAVTHLCTHHQPAIATKRFYTPSLGAEVHGKRQWFKLKALRNAISKPKRASLTYDLEDTRLDVMADDTAVGNLANADYAMFALRRMTVPYLRSKAIRPLAVAAMLQQIHSDSRQLKAQLINNPQLTTYDYVVIGGGPHAQQAVETILERHYQAAYAREQFDAEPPSILVVERSGNIAPTFSKNRSIRANSPSRGQTITNDQLGDAAKYGNRNPTDGAILPTDLSTELFPMLGDVADAELANHFATGVSTLMYTAAGRIKQVSDGQEIVELTDVEDDLQASRKFTVGATRGVIIATGIGTPAVPSGLDNTSQTLLQREMNRYYEDPNTAQVITAEQLSQRLAREGRARYLGNGAQPHLPIAIIGGANSSYTALEQLFGFNATADDTSVLQEGVRRDVIIFAGKNAAQTCEQVRAKIPARYAPILKVLFAGIGFDGQPKPLSPGAVRSKVNRLAGPNDGAITSVKKLNNGTFRITTPREQYIVGDIILTTGYARDERLEIEDDTEFALIPDTGDARKSVGARAYTAKTPRRIIKVGPAVGPTLVTDEEADGNPDNKVSLFKTKPKTKSAVLQLLSEIDDINPQALIASNARTVEAQLTKERQKNKPILARQKQPSVAYIDIERVGKGTDSSKLPALPGTIGANDARYEVVLGAMLKSVSFPREKTKSARTFRIVIDNNGGISADGNLTTQPLADAINQDPIVRAVLYPFFSSSPRARSIAANQIIITGTYDAKGNVVLDKNFNVALSR